MNIINFLEKSKGKEHYPSLALEAEEKPKGNSQGLRKRE
jgi:hypothetical protein